MRWHKFPLLVGFYLVQRRLHDLGVKKKKIKQQQQQQQQKTPRTVSVYKAAVF